ncbi:MAG: HEAT repeat domain-containing protein [Anaerolineales bacterium]|jgi:HEAT repeat protein
MTTSTKQKVRHTQQAKLLIQAMEGEAAARDTVLKYLSSTNPSLCKMMQEAIHDLCDRELWQNLLSCLATHRWDNRHNSNRLSSPQASDRFDHAIIEVFTQDENEAEIPIKEAVLHRSMNDPQTRIRGAAAYLAGLRGNREAIPLLGEIIDRGSKSWQLRAIKALAVLDDERCIPPLTKALTMDRDLLHREARRALQSMGSRAKSAWMELLHHPDSHIRWEAARGLGEIGDARAAPILAEGLLDENYAVRWATADVLANLGEKAIPVTLTILSRYPLNEPKRQAAYHALHGIANRKAQERIKSLLDALRDPAASFRVPSLAQRLLLEWEKI